MGNTQLRSFVNSLRHCSRQKVIAKKLHLIKKTIK